MNNDEPRPYTAEEEFDEFMSHMRDLSRYWAKQPDMTPQERCDGLLHSILTTIDGCTGGMPGYELSISVHPDNEAFHKEEGENWHQIGLKLPTDCMWHDALHQT